MNLLKHIGVLCLLMTMIIACTKPPDYPDEPVITFERLSKNSMAQNFLLSDSLLVTLSFTDGDGDLGDLESDSVSIVVRDIRLPETAPTTNYKIPFIPTQGAGNGISGTISFVLYTSCCIHPDPDLFPCSVVDEYPTDTLIYEIFIKDRANNISNTIQTAPIILRCE